MPQALGPDAELDRGDGALPSRRPLAARSLLVLWPAFVMAGVLEALVFSVVDPGSLHGFGGEWIAWSASTVYSVSFFIFWGAIAVATGITKLLEAPDEAGSRPFGRRVGASQT